MCIQLYFICNSLNIILSDKHATNESVGSVFLYTVGSASCQVGLDVYCNGALDSGKRYM